MKSGGGNDSKVWNHANYDKSGAQIKQKRKDNVFLTREVMQAL